MKSKIPQDNTVNWTVKKLRQKVSSVTDKGSNPSQVNSKVWSLNLSQSLF